MNEDEKEAIECLELVIDSESDIETEDLTNKCIINILNLIKKQQKKIEKLEDRNKTLEIEFEIKKYCKVNELASDLMFYKNLARNYQGNCISKDKIKEKIEEITSYAYTSVAERDCQDYAIQVLKELLQSGQESDQEGGQEDE